MSDLVQRLTTKAAMIEMGERIAWGSDTAIMREAATRIKELEAEKRKQALEIIAAHEQAHDAYEAQKAAEARAEAAEARVARLEAALENCLAIIDALKDESGREIEYGAEDAFRMGEWFEDAELKAIEDARAALSEDGGEDAATG